LNATKSGLGIDFYTFRKGLREVALENKLLAKRIFDLMDDNDDRKLN
jgi:hypothetical protein